jgi:tetratricopeptide (TPR) repeat protein
MPSPRQNCLPSANAFFLLGILILISYSNSFRAAWHFDDYPNILFNPNVHIDNLSLEDLKGSFYEAGSNQSRLRRPTAAVTFAVNWYFGKDNVSGYHAVNIFIHILTAFFLFLTSAQLFRTPAMAPLYNENQVHFCALLSAALWAVHPIQTQAVTYIVQRMASLSAMFYILAIWLYLKGRNGQHQGYAVFFYAGVLLCFLLAVGAKENAVLLPLSLLLAEIIFFEHLKEKKKRKFLLLFSGFAGLAFFLGVLLLMKGNLFSFLHGYELRFFSLSERMMTQPGILVLYLSQLFWPVADRLSLMHDVEISTSLLNPRTTIPCILIVLSLISAGIALIHRKPLVSFSILFFFLNHLVESSIVPLEMVYEHRNYLPSFFLFLPIAFGIQKGLEHFRTRPLMYGLVTVFVIFILISEGIGTYTRNRVWATEKSLWTDTVRKAPGLARPVHNLAECYSKEGNDTAALHLYKTALHLKDMRNGQKAYTYHNMGNIYLKQKDYETAADYYQKAVQDNPSHTDARYNLVLVLVHLHKTEAALKTADRLLSGNKKNPEYHNLKGMIHVKTGDTDTALYHIKKALILSPANKDTLFYMGICLSKAGNYEKSLVYLKRAFRLSPNNIQILLHIIDNMIKSENERGTGRAIEIFFNNFTVSSLRKALSASGKSVLLPDISADLSEELYYKLNQISETVNSFGLLKAEESVEK